MKDKRGFIRILEAMIAIVIVFVYIVNILPKLPKPTGKIPGELDNTLSAILKQIQNDAQFRKTVVVDRDMEKINSFIATSIPTFSSWRFGFRVCTSGTETLPNPDCSYYFEGNGKSGADFNAALVSTGTAIYTKAVFLSKVDVTAPGVARIACPRNSASVPPSDPSYCPVYSVSSPDACCENQVLTLYMWSNV